jgi:hypothetical protein
MTKQAWMEHARTAGDHDRKSCPQCAARRKTRASNAARTMRDEVYKSFGMVKVRGALGGTYYE